MNTKPRNVLICLQSHWGVGFAISSCTAEAARLYSALTVPVANTSVQQWAPCQLAFNSSSYFLDRLDTKPVFQKTQHPSHCITEWASVTLVSGCYFLDDQGTAKWAHPPRPFSFQHPCFLKGRKLANAKKCQQSSKPPCHLKAKSCKIPIFPVKGWVLSCLVKLFLTAGRASAACRAALLIEKRETSTAQLLRPFYFGLGYCFLNRCTNFLSRFL